MQEKNETKKKDSSLAFIPALTVLNSIFISFFWRDDSELLISPKKRCCGMKIGVNSNLQQAIGRLHPVAWPLTKKCKNRFAGICLERISRLNTFARKKDEEIPHFDRCALFILTHP